MSQNKNNQNGLPPQLLFIDDEKAFQRFIYRNLSPDDYEVVVADHWKQAKEMLDENLVRPSIIFVEPWPLDESTGLEVLEEMRAEREKIPVVVISSQRDPRGIVEAVQGGAVEYLVKPFKRDRLQSVIERFLDKSRRTTRSRARKTSRDTDLDFVFCNPQMEKINETVLQVADSMVPVLIQGESGVGKDVIARLIHRHSRLVSRNFVKVNCAALPPELTESELFGHTRGAFTGAVIDRPGKFEFAHGGTIFLDEIGEFSAAAQAKLLQVLQEGRFNRLGSNEEVEVEVRVIAATNRDLSHAMQEKQFRSDLFFRLNVVNVHVPALRDRKDEIPLLCEHFLKKFGAQLGVDVKPIPSRLVESFQRYSWPGNVRELENLLKRYLVLGDPESIWRELESKGEEEDMEAVDEAVEKALDGIENGVGLKEIAKQAAAKVERNLIAKTLSRTNWNRLQAAKELNVSYKTLLTRIDEYKITP